MPMEAPPPFSGQILWCLLGLQGICSGSVLEGYPLGQATLLPLAFFGYLLQFGAPLSSEWCSVWPEPVWRQEESWAPPADLSGNGLQTWVWD